MPPNEMVKRLPNFRQSRRDEPKIKMHYRNGRKAEVGDQVVGVVYNTQI
jgi:hypothetical protein